MKIKILKQVFLKNIQHVQNIISFKSGLPILLNILIEAEKNKVALTSTDLDIGISSVLETEVEEEGAITIPAKRFNDIIKELPDEEIFISTMKNNSMVIKCSKSQNPVYLKDDKAERFYIRTGPSTTELTASQTQEYIKQKFK
ncbi:MAG: hypothetical protein COS29_05435 [Candidatus Omnitrophica bacterium CG02_land_8_20_14_3_00__42_8]|nr:MAG: hypothetical protein COS29_05435 [Candidatus Omnitrophica bacterium CG02_land_8_20_14_3_00__42_8]